MADPAAAVLPPPAAPAAPAAVVPPVVPPAAAPPAPEPKTLLGGDPAKPEEVKPPEVKKDEPKKDDKPIVPEKYDLKAPEGALLAPAQLEKIAAFARERGFSNEQAQALVEHQNGAVKEYVDRQVGAFKNDAFVEWPKQALAHPDLGAGDPVKHKEAVAVASRAFEKFASPALKQMAKESGYGNHPEFVAAWNRVGKAMGEDKFLAAPNPASPRDPEAWRKTLYDATPEEGK